MRRRRCFSGEAKLVELLELFQHLFAFRRPSGAQQCLPQLEHRFLVARLQAQGGLKLFDGVRPPLRTP